MKAANYYAGHQEAEGAVVTVTRSGRTKPLDPRFTERLVEQHYNAIQTHSA